MGNSDFISQFMWAYQRSFAILVELEAKRLLERTGFAGHPRVILIGFEASEQHAYPVCIEPEDGPYAPSDLDGVLDRAADLYGQHPDRDMYYGAPHFRQEKQDKLRNRLRAQAIEDQLGAHAASAGRAFFASPSARRDDYEVHVVLSIDTNALKQVPRLEEMSEWHGPASPSIVEAIILELLDQAHRELYLPGAGHIPGGIGYGLPEIWQRALQRMLRTAIDLAGHAGGAETAEQLGNIASLLYEGRPSAGRLVISPQGSPAVDVVLRLHTPVHLAKARHMRKLLESSGSDLALLMDDHQVYGFGTVTDSDEHARRSIFEIDIDKGGRWRLSRAGTTLFSAQDGVPRLPVPTLDTAYLHDVITRLLPDADTVTLDGLAMAASKHTHGAMLIISSDAAGEAARLAPQAARTEPIRLTPQLLSQLTNMDGGVLVDTQGRCHAIGVILDGTANGNGDASRGSRFNNAIRYLDSDAPAAVVVCYSSDGDITILPSLMPRRDRKEITQLVERYLAVSTALPLRLEDAAELNDEIKANAFYLSADQCEQVKQARAKINEWRTENGRVTVIEPDLLPDPLMNESYWLHEHES
ncbi:DNA integrity scanning protein DisA nucleotide-binding domain protein [Streptomyces gibsoniae]|uniref:Diadenylate cyclase n=1 Tax=Streptomyces gibsoniae TaxID=3075529 RepID=A0ABU2U5A5_9ACTN|nr:diadenylate cyclase [Streptomyces sp. DSM 41699]MDT0468343.1 diadenylate cyclase [Streptomyces sp. DSM 41699]